MTEIIDFFFDPKTTRPKHKGQTVGTRKSVRVREVSAYGRLEM